jgi:hypothetical protein
MLSACATWNPNATTFANATTFGPFPHGIFLNTNNTLYVGSWTGNFVKVWLSGQSTPIRTFTGGLYQPWSLFVSQSGDLYVDNAVLNGQVDKWAANATNASSSVKVMNINASCFGLFIDTNNFLYCSIWSYNIVIKGNITTGLITPTLVAGNGTSGSAPNMLNNPTGIFVDTNFDLYVADATNNRIQCFQLGQQNGITVAGTAVGFPLNSPRGVVLDANGYMFIMDSGNFRIIASSSTGFRCVAACSGASGSTADTLLNARYLAFDSYGNIFVTDDDNNRIQKFILSSNSCGKFVQVSRRNRLNRFRPYSNSIERIPEV